MNPLFALLLWVSTALAGPWAEIDAVWEDQEGRWRGVAASDQGRVNDTPGLVRGQELVEQDRVETSGARVRIRFDSGEQIVVEPQGRLVLEDRGVLQELGEALYDVRGVFQVRCQGVEAAVEGTRFTVALLEDGTVEVTVLEGVVKVTDVDGQVRVVRGEMARGLPDGQAPTATSSGGAAAGAKALSRQLSLPRLSGGVVVGGAFAAQSLQLQTRLTGRARLTPGLWLSTDLGIETFDARFHLPLSAGLETQLGPVALGLQSHNLLGQEVCPDGSVETRLHPGAVASVRWMQGLPGPFAVELQVRAGYARDVFVDGGVGISAGR
jgi:hypothetical protein